MSDPKSTLLIILPTQISDLVIAKETIRTTALLYILIFTLISNDAASQVGGISAGKINSFNHVPIPKGTAEFEPNYGFSSSSKQWDSRGNLVPLFSTEDSLSISTSVSFRMAYALTNKVEIGTFISSEFSNWSFKYTLLDKINGGIGIMGGINLPYGNANIKRGRRTTDQTVSYSLGLVGSVEIDDLSSIDINVQRQDYFSSTDINTSKQDLFFSMDYGKYLGETGIQLMASVTYQNSNFEAFSSNVFSVYPGISLEMKDNYFIIANAFFDLSGKNNAKTHGFAIAWTITL